MRFVLGVAFELDCGKLMDELKARNRELEAKLLMAGNGNRGTIRVRTKQKVTKCVVVGDSMLRNVGAEHADLTAECFPGIKTELLHGNRKEGCRQSRNGYYSRGYY